MSYLDTRRSLGILIISSLFILGCAKHNKPDNDPMADAPTVSDKSLDFSLSGSDSGSIEGLNSIHFDYDKSAITEDNRKILVQNAQWLKTNKNTTMQIEGHCDRHGSVEYNLALGQRRAETVKSYLVNLGVSPKRLSTISYGKEKLIDMGETDSADYKNRRVNFKPNEPSKLNHLSAR